MNITFDSESTDKVFNHIRNHAAPPQIVYGVIIPTGWKKISLKGILDPDNGVDSDSDTLTDWEEVKTEMISWDNDGSVILPTAQDCIDSSDKGYALSGLERFKSAEYRSGMPSSDFEKKLHYICNNTTILPIHSNPCDVDSDGDSFPDKYVETLSTELYYPYDDPNPLKSDVTDTALKNDFFSVDYDFKDDDALEDWKAKNNGKSASYGGYQGWMGKYGYTKDINVFCNQQVSGATMHSYGCGIIAVADMFMYLFISNDNNGFFNYGDWAMYLGNDFNGIDFDIYVFYIMMISNYFCMYGKPINGTVASYLPFNLKTSIKAISSLNEMNLNVEWGSSTDPEKCLKNMKSMINNDIPVIFSCSVRESNAMQLYCMKNHIYTKNDYIKDDGSYEIAPTVDAHYMVATGIIEYSDDAKRLVGREKMIRIATYGKEYYVDFDDYADRLSSIDTNIMIIKK